jgi:hypothetical protein
MYVQEVVIVARDARCPLGGEDRRKVQDFRDIPGSISAATRCLRAAFERVFLER